MSTRTRLSILAVEDNPADYNLIQIHLKESSVKHDLLHADTFFDAVECCKNNEVSLVLLDLSLPDSTGFKTLSNFLEKIDNIPVIVLTGINNEIVGNQAIKAGAQDFLVKGQFDGKLLGRSIRYSIQRYKTHLKLDDVATELAISKKRYLEAQEMAHFGNWEVDLVSNEMKWTAEVYNIFGFQPNSFQPTLSGYLSYVHLEDKAEVEEFFELAAKDGKTHKMEHRIVVDGTTIKYLALQAKVYFEEINGKILLVGVVQDITERKLSEQLIIEKNISSKASKIKEEALDDIGFHIRTPLSSIINLLFLLEKTTVSNQQGELIEGLKISVDDLSIMINNLLNFSVLISEKITVEEAELNLKDFFQSLQKVSKIKADNSSVKLDFQISDKLPEKVISDGNKLTQVLYNMLDYIIKQTSQDQDLKLKASVDAQSEKPKLIIETHHAGSTLDRQAIQELLESDKLLQVYENQSSPIQQNQQMGMAIVTKLIKTLEGELQINSSEQDGTVFRMEIPVSIPRKIAKPADDKPDAPLRILLVEDHFLNQIATKKVLTTWSEMVSVDIAENGLIGVEKHREHNYDLILMDLQMPVMNGLESTRKIREQSNVPIIALTANSSKQEADKCAEIGFNDYMAKPFKPQDLYARIMNLLVAVS
ncbi:MAG: response regulator [Bacteroidota bacterium]